MKKIFCLIISIIFCVSALTLTACFWKKEEEDTLKLSYDYYVEYTKGKGETPLSYKEWEKVFSNEKESENPSIQDVYIKSIKVNDKGELEVIYSNGTTDKIDKFYDKDVPSSYIVSAKVNIMGELVLTYSDGKKENLGNILQNGDKTEDLTEVVKTVKRSSVAIKSTSGNGSGVLVDMGEYGKNDSNEVYIITCHHMIDKKGMITVYIPDKNGNYDNKDYTFGGEIGDKIYTDEKIKYVDVGEADVAVTLVGGDKDSDIAVLQLDLNKCAISGNKLSISDLVLAKLPSKNYKMELGEKVFAVGNPTGTLPGTLSVGNISYLEREDEFISDLGNMNLMQIDVSINPGNSGGGLYNLKGELIAITNAGSTAYTNINYAIPYELSNGNGYLSIASKLISTKTDTNYGYVEGRKEKMGFTTSQSFNYLLDRYELTVSAITVGSVAEEVGLKVNDIIIGGKLNSGDRVNFKLLEELTALIKSANAGD
ncbi:MAG: trypsin-like peptidase domain-containing protein, partial [Clostridia bacterium]|nr:trypsin-like peptidase domain-containing protein [Clostridia bacterium]